VFIDYMLEAYTPLLGSDYTFNRSTIGARFFLPLLDSLTLALRGAYTDVNGRAPFNMLHYFAYTDYTYDGLGGDYSGRGYLRNRFFGNTMTLFTVEPRWTFWESDTGAWKTVLVLFMDSGNVYDDGTDPFTDSRWGEYKNSYGGGLVLAYARSLLIHCYYGWSKEFSGVYLNFNHVF
jgi:outer membrane protein assembly factor BamA